MTLDELKNGTIFSIGGKNVNFVQYFVGTSYLNMISTEQVVIGNVTFEPACRNSWHIHHADNGGGQILLVTAGRGYYQEWGKDARELKPGDVINRPLAKLNRHIKVADTSKQGKTESKSLSSITVSF